jgi:hypothetical protein
MNDIFSPIHHKKHFNWKSDANAYASSITPPSNNLKNSWRGKTFQEVSSQIQRNAGLHPTQSDNTNLFLPNPLKIYRREIGTTPCHSRTSLKIDVLNQPNGYTLKPHPDGTFDAQLIKTDLLPMNNATDACNAAARSRSSSGIIQHTVENGIVKSSYCTSSQGVTDRKRKKALAQTPINLPYTEKNRGLTESGTYTTQKKYDTLTDGGLRMRTSEGLVLSQSIAYNVPAGGYTKKAWNQPFPNVCVS